MAFRAHRQMLQCLVDRKRSKRRNDASCLEEGGNVGVLPRHLNVTAKTVEKEKIGGPLPEHLVGRDVGISDG